jgi:hypothetical protein
MTFAFDTLSYVRKLRTAKVPEEQAEAMADALTGALNAPVGVATKTDFARIETELVLHRWLFGAVFAVQLATLGGVITILARMVR